MVFDMRNILVFFLIFIINYNTTIYPKCENNNIIKKKLTVTKSNLSGKFKIIDPTKSGLIFKNSVDEWAASLNRTLYNGAGVAVGDYNKDGLPDIFMCSVDGKSKLFKNLGGFTFREETLPNLKYGHRSAVFADLDGNDWLDLIIGTIENGIILLANVNGKFKDITQNSGLNGIYSPMTIALADINNDSYIDIYVSNNRSRDIRDEGSVKLARRKGQIIIPPKYKDRLIMSNGVIKEYGAEDHLFINKFNMRFDKVDWTDGMFLDSNGNKLNKVPLDWGLAAAFHDVNNDGLQDLYVCNDFWTPDRFWLNLGGRFQLLDNSSFKKISASSMGVDFSDFDRDGDIDVFVVDMLSRELKNRKRQMHAQNKSDNALRKENEPMQVMRNTFLSNNGDGTFAEVSQMVGLSASEWSWSPLFIDVDLDGYEDLLITAGHFKDIQDLDVNALIKNKQKPRDKRLSPERRKIEFAKEMMQNNRLYPDLKMPVIAFRNNQNGQFEDMTKIWGTEKLGVHHGIATGDFDLDGDLDLVVNNMNENAAVYENTFWSPRIAVVLKGLKPNTSAIGSKVYLQSSDGFNQIKEVVSGGRYLSDSEDKIVFGLNKINTGLTIKVRWKSGNLSTIKNVKANYEFTIDEKYSSREDAVEVKNNIKDLFTDNENLLNFVHHENDFDDLALQPLLPFKLSKTGPAVSVVDINKDELDDIIFGCSKGGSITVYLNNGAGGFLAIKDNYKFDDDINSIFHNDEKNVFYSINKGFELDVVSIKKHTLKKNTISTEISMILPIKSVGSFARADIDNDGDIDYFIGGGAFPSKYPESSNSLILLNKKNGFSQDLANQNILSKSGIVNSAVFYDFESDGYPELIIAGHWQPVRFFNNINGRLSNQSMKRGIDKGSGLWNCLKVGDINNDGLMDFIVGNYGLNSKYIASEDNPLSIVYGDFNDDGSYELIESIYENGILVPIRQFNDLVKFMPFLYDRFQSFNQYSSASVADVLGNKNAKILQVHTLESAAYLNLGKKFIRATLPNCAQLAPTNDVVISDFNKDLNQDIILAQNYFNKITGNELLNASGGVVLTYENKNFKEVKRSGIKLGGEQNVVEIGDFNNDKKPDVIFSVNNNKSKIFINSN